MWQLDPRIDPNSSTGRRRPGSQSAPSRSARSTNGGTRGAVSRRFPLPVLVPIAVILALASGCSTNMDHPPADDVHLGACQLDSGSGRAVVAGTATNSSSRRSDYLIWVDVAANDSKIETGFALVPGVDPNTRKDFTIKAFGAAVPSGTSLTCTLKGVSRGPSDPFERD